jgi:hypothetical protein
MRKRGLAAGARMKLLGVFGLLSGLVIWGLFTGMAAPASAASDPSSRAGHYLFAWTGDAAGKDQDFIAVIDADPASVGYGHVVASAASGISSRQVHHTEYWMPDSGQLFANDHMAGETAIFDLRDPLRPTVRTKFASLAGYSHPHSFLRLPNGHVLASFQFEGNFSHDGMDPVTGHGSMLADDPSAHRGVHGGLVEIDEDGHAVRATSTADSSHADDPLMAYSLLPLPDIDRVLVTNSGMRDQDPNGQTYQMFRLSDLKLLSTEVLDPGNGQFGQINPEEARRGPDGAVYIQTLGCGVERVSDLAAAHPKSHLIYQFPGSMCGVPSLVSHYWIQSVPILHAVVVVDLAAAGGPKEISRVVLDGAILPHWTGYDSRTRRLAVTGYGEARLFMLIFDPATGALALDQTFHDEAGRPGFDAGSRVWPHGWTGAGEIHGVVFSK